MRRRPEFHILCTELGPYSGYSDFDSEEIGWGLHQEVRVWPQGKILEVTFSKDEKGLPQEEYEEVKASLQVWKTEMPEESCSWVFVDGPEAASKVYKSSALSRRVRLLTFCIFDQFGFAETVVGCILGSGGAMHPYRFVTAILRKLLDRHAKSVLLTLSNSSCIHV